ncbi:type IV pilus modification protein PilV [Teredinibacter sp. KSP-S5-2]|uniref:type IV pilus modification protein PilV n=1 Tax=Teredinibacter sp. KSP-S5-2 TaxID=3034506 RepID=UPI0029349F89|nr:type IV pilus modification protein PilV [Teredinibacter sp. KSP-S5-2]WNO09861.1 type IV pilus modification protein PilV [Teredinibacter sp. KSP-S5-2]
MSLKKVLGNRVQRVDKTAGSSLIEVMVALFLLAVGMLGVLAMQANSIKLNNNAYLYSQADMLSKEILEAIHSCGDRGNNAKACIELFKIGLDDSSPGGANCEGSTCGYADLARWYIREWRENIENQLPAGKGAISYVASTTPDNTTNYDVTITIEFSLGVDRESNAVGRQGGSVVPSDVIKERVTLKTTIVHLGG